MKLLVKLFKVDYLDNSYDSYREIIKGITDWEEVSEEAFEILKCNSLGYKVIAQIGKEEFKITVEQVLKEHNKLVEKQKKLNLEYKKTEAERKQKALNRKLEKAKKLLEENKIA